MFGGWGQNAQNQQSTSGQQAPTTGAFGQPVQPSTFGSGFGQTSAFGTQQQQPQPSVFGASNQPSQPTSGFGMSLPPPPIVTWTNIATSGSFGQPKPAFGASTSAFGQPNTQPTTSTFGGFGSTAPTTSTFGSSTSGTTGGLFGRPAASSGAFGTTPASTTGGIFGAKPATTSAFGTSVTAAGSNGTASPTYLVTQDREGTNSAPSNYHSITAMPAYRNFSFEELRMQDYAAGRKTASGGAFGQQSAFGTTPAAPSTGVGAFGQTNPGTSTFGQPATNSAFGQSSTTGAFGQANPPTSTFGGFGQPSNTTSTGLFGQNQNQPTTSTFGQPATGGGMFGSSAFGQSQQQPPSTGLFGSTANTNPAFGQNTGTKPAFGGFGQQQQQQQQQPASTTGFGGFGQTTQPNTSTSLFGQTQPAQPQQSNAFGGFGTTFGSNDASKPAFGTGNASQPSTGLFGQAAPTTQENKPAFGGFGTGLFGQQQQQPQQQQPGQQPSGGLFGSNQPAQPNQPSGGLFGGSAFTQNPPQNQTQQTAAPAFGTSLFAPKPTQPATGGLFGNTQAQQPASTGLFGSNPAPTLNSGLFGNLGGGQAQSQPQTQSLFGPKPAGTGLFGASTINTTTQPANPLLSSTAFSGGLGGGNSLFASGAQNRPLGQQGSLVATVDGNIYNNPLLQSNAGDGARIITLTDPDKKSVLLYTKKHVPKVVTPKVGRLRGFSTPPSNGLSSSVEFGSSPSSPFSRPLSVNSSRLGTALGGLSDSTSSVGLNPEAFRARSSVKKLILPSKVDPSNWSESFDVAVQSASADSGGLGITTSTSKPRVSWDRQLGRAARESTMVSAGSPKTPTTLDRNMGRLPGPSTSTTTGAATEPASKSPVSVLKSKTSDSSREVGEYWTVPSLQELKESGFEKLSHLPNFVVHRTGIGRVEFLEDVNLTTLRSVDDIPGGYVIFDNKECIVYPDDTDKPPVGEGLNVPARITLLGCWPMDKSTQRPITDANHPKSLAHVKKLKAIPDTNFEKYDAETGAWTFVVPHFTRYGLDDEDESEEELERALAVEAATPDQTPSKSPVPQSDHEDSEEEVTHPDRESVQLSHQEEMSVDDTTDEEDEVPVKESVEGPRPTQRPWPATLGLDRQRMKVMQASFFHTQPEAVVDEEAGRVQRNAELSRAVTSMGPERMGGAAPAVNVRPEVLASLRDLEPVRYMDSMFVGAESHFVDAGLALARSFRVGWGPNGLLAHFGRICTPSAEGSAATPSVVSLERLPLLSAADDAEVNLATRLLQLQGSETEIDVDEDNVPVAIPNANLRFADYAGLFSGDDRSHEAMVWRLGAALFDARRTFLAENVTYEVETVVKTVRAKAALSDWLATSVSPAVEEDLRRESLATDARRALIMLTGHQVERASETAMNGGDLSLAMLIASTGGDEASRGYLLKQLEVWRKQNADAFIDPAYRCVMGLLAGRPNVGEVGVDDWKRAFGLCLWYGTALEESGEEALQLYTERFEGEEGVVPRPTPWYKESGSTAKGLQWTKRTEISAYDALYQLMRLSVDKTFALEDVLVPEGYFPSPFDHRLPWHLYVLLSSIMRVRDFQDRLEIGRGGNGDDLNEGVMGTSVRAQSLTVRYASQLEYLGRIEEAIFVLLHLEQPEGRTQTIKELLVRHAGEWDEASLALRALYDNNTFEAYQSFMTAGLEDMAHDIAVSELAPEIVIRGDVMLLHQLFAAFAPSKVKNWHERGLLYLQYAECMLDIPRLLQALVQEPNDESDPTDEVNLRRLAQLVPHLLENLPKLFEHRGEDVKQRVCLAEMLSGLVRLLGPLMMQGVTSKPHGQAMILPEQARLEYIQSSCRERFFHSLEIMSSA
ncbi:hypothetical protein FRB99_003101 [Tulasnella sp. 403]|nr:hypothetical protein FRB99_003101 [Tulasnella sp. 403]